MHTFGDKHIAVFRCGSPGPERSIIIVGFINVDGDDGICRIQSALYGYYTLQVMRLSEFGILGMPISSSSGHKQVSTFTRNNFRPSKLSKWWGLAFLQLVQDGWRRPRRIDYGSLIHSGLTLWSFALRLSFHVTATCT